MLSNLDRLRGSSPHTRGALHDRVGGPHRPGIIPAYAGSTRVGPPGVAGPGDHPRIRGEHYFIGGAEHGLDGSSPHTRGAPASATAPHTEARIIPAYAGSTPA